MNDEQGRECFLSRNRATALTLFISRPVCRPYAYPPTASLRARAKRCGKQSRKNNAVHSVSAKHGLPRGVPPLAMTLENYLCERSSKVRDRIFIVRERATALTRALTRGLCQAPQGRDRSRHPDCRLSGHGPVRRRTKTSDGRQRPPAARPWRRGPHP